MAMDTSTCSSAPLAAGKPINIAATTQLIRPMYRTIGNARPLSVNMNALGLPFSPPSSKDAGRLPVLSARRIAALHRSGAWAPGPVRVKIKAHATVRIGSPVQRDLGLLPRFPVHGSGLHLTSKISAWAEDGGKQRRVDRVGG